jgi:hypothetical protein
LPRGFMICSLGEPAPTVAFMSLMHDRCALNASKNGVSLVFWLQVVVGS